MLQGCSQRLQRKGLWVRIPVLYFQQVLLMRDVSHSPCPPGTHSSPPHPLSPPLTVPTWRPLLAPTPSLSPWCDSLVSPRTWSHLTACCRLLTSRVPLPPCCCSLVCLPLPATAPRQLSTWRLLSSLPSLSLAHFFFVAHVSFSVLAVPRLVLTITRSSWGRCHRITGLSAVPPPLGQGSHPPSPPPSAGSCSSTCPGSVSSQRSGPASTEQRSSQPWSTCTRGTWCTATSR